MVPVDLLFRATPFLCATRAAAWVGASREVLVPAGNIEAGDSTHGINLGFPGRQLITSTDQQTPRTPNSTVDVVPCPAHPPGPRHEPRAFPIAMIDRRSRPAHRRAPFALLYTECLGTPSCSKEELISGAASHWLLGIWISRPLLARELSQNRRIPPPSLSFRSLSHRLHSRFSAPTASTAPLIPNYLTSYVRSDSTSLVHSSHHFAGIPTPW